MPPLRVVLDANVVVSALLRPDSAPGRVLRAAIEARDVVLVTSEPLLRELAAVLVCPRLRPYLHLSARDRDAFVVLLEQLAEPVDLTDYPAPGLCLDPADEPYLQTALAGRAGYLVSGDGDLLTLGQVEAIPIVAPAALDRLLSARAGKSWGGAPAGPGTWRAGASATTVRRPSARPAAVLMAERERGGARRQGRVRVGPARRRGSRQHSDMGSAQHLGVGT